VWAGSTLWWVVLTSIVTWLRERVSTRVLLWVNRVSGAVLVVFGIVAVVAALA
jgi:threonine/homoserine/homoserine lactone efflux protein